MSDGSVLTALVLFMSAMATIGFAIGVYCLIEVKALKQSTHSVQYVEAPYPGTKTDENGFEELDEEVKGKLDPDFYN